MKPFIFFFFFTLSCFAQVNNFTAKNNLLVWENVFISNEANIPSFLAKYPRFRLTPVSGKVYKGVATEIKNTCPGTSAFMDSEMSFNFEIEESVGKYRITVTNITFLHKGKAIMAEDYLIKRGSIKNTNQSQTDLECLENYFNRVFTLTQVLKNKM